jgi:hypothetical protein
MKWFLGGVVFVYVAVTAYVSYGLHRLRVWVEEA